MKADELRDQIIISLRSQGFKVQNGRIAPPPRLDKEAVRKLHAFSVQDRIKKAEAGLRRHEPRLLKRLAAGSEVSAEKIIPRLIEVRRRSEDELLFRYATLHWSIPVSSGYGRRLRFLVIDEQNDKLIGLIGLGDPVFNLGPRDRWIGWEKRQRRQHLYHVMDAFLLGAVPPYSFLLCGKLVAMLAASTEVRKAFKRKYGQRRSLIWGRTQDGRLALITTTSALGRSSLYNRITYDGRHLYHRAGFTRGWGEFHFSNGLYDEIWRFATEHCQPTAKQEQWGKGFRNRREVIKKCLKELKLSSEWLNHGIEREVFVVPLAKNCQQFLKGEHVKLQWFSQSAEDIFAYFRDRWLLPRARRDSRYKEFRPSSYRLWHSKD